MDYTKICISCMHEKKEAYEVCEKCGFDPREYKTPSQALMPFVVLNGRYLIGKVLGAGGFGIVYIAYDMALLRTCAVKEFFVSGKMHRRVDEVLQAEMNPEDELFCQAAKEKFVREARVLAQLERLPGIFLNVYDFFEENGTSYLVMDYLEGKTLKQYIEENRGNLVYTEILDKIRPVIQSLQKLHEKDILHRDISPDNLQVQEDGSLSLVDFGNVGALDSAENKHQSKLTTVKPGYSPIEQYTSEGIMGPWTDEYAMAATIYYCVTEVVPSEATERVEKEDFARYTLNAKCPEMPANVKDAILKGMGIHKEERFPDMKSFEDALYPPPPLPSDENRWERLLRWNRLLNIIIRKVFIVLLIPSIVVGAVIILSSLKDSPAPAPSGASPTPVVISPVPTATSAPEASQEQIEEAATSEEPDWQTVYPLNRDVPVGAVVGFGFYPQDSEDDSLIYWYVVDKEDDKVLLVSKYVLDRPGDHEADRWERSKIRDWLNGTFITRAFKIESSRARICMSTIDNNSIEDLKDQEGPEQGVDGRDTEDRIFLLSVGEERKYLYNHGDMVIDQYPGEIIPTKYAVSHGASENDVGHGINHTRSFSRDGSSWSTYLAGEDPGGDASGVRPAMWVYTGNVYYSKEKIKQAQESMLSKGYACGTPDGLLGARTVQALKDYQKDNNLSVTGILTEETYESLF